MHNTSGFKFLIILFLALYTSLSFSQETKNVPKSLLINSLPAGAEVYIGNILAGKTPLVISDFTHENVTITAVYDGVERSEFLPSLKLDYEIFFIFDGNYGILDVETVPAGADFFINDSLIGKTPINNYKLEIGKYRIRIKKDDYLDLDYPLNVYQKKYPIKRELSSIYGYLNLESTDKFDYEIDDKLITDKKNNLQFGIGNHEVTSIEKATGKTVSRTLLLKSAQQINVNTHSGYFTTKYILYSTFIPGLGQFLDNNKIVGSTLFAGTVASGLLYFRAKNLYKVKKDELNELKELYPYSKSEEEAYGYSEKMKSLVEETNSQATKSNTALAIFVGVYVVNLLDALIFHNKGRRIEFTTSQDELGSSFGLKINFN